MTDVVDKATRSRMMSGIRGKNTSPEIAVRRYLHATGLRYRLHVKELPGKPDLVFPQYGLVVFVHGCFWHRHHACQYAYTPKSNLQFWKKKFDDNVRRDAEVTRKLRAAGWRVWTVWECEVSPAKLNALAEKIRKIDRG